VAHSLTRPSSASIPALRVLAALCVLIGILFHLGDPMARAQTDVDQEYLLVPGQSMGAVRLGMSLEDVEAVLGLPSDTRTESGYQWYFFGNQSASTMNGAGVYMNDGKVASARAFASAYRTAQGLGVGSTLPELAAVYGVPERQVTSQYRFNASVQIDELYAEWASIGISAHIDRRSHRVAFIDIDTRDFPVCTVCFALAPSTALPPNPSNRVLRRSGSR
jgi:hypothetical protein